MPLCIFVQYRRAPRCSATGAEQARIPILQLGHGLSAAAHGLGHRQAAQRMFRMSIWCPGQGCDKGFAEGGGIRLRSFHPACWAPVVTVSSVLVTCSAVAAPSATGGVPGSRSSYSACGSCGACGLRGRCSERLATVWTILVAPARIGPRFRFRLSVFSLHYVLEHVLATWQSHDMVPRPAPPPRHTST